MIAGALRRCLRARPGFSPARCLSSQPAHINDSDDGASGPEGEEVEVISYAVSNSPKTVDKSGLDMGRVKRFDMSRPLPGIPGLKAADELPVSVLWCKMPRQRFADCLPSMHC
jgi:hypothetical protein